LENQNNITLIEAYYEGRLSAEEKVEFELRLVYDAGLAEELRIYKKLRSGFNMIKAERIRKRLQILDDELDKGGAENNNRKLFYLLAGLAASLAIAIFAYRQIPETGDFHADMIPIEAGLPVLMGANSHLEFNNAMTNFKAGEFGSSSKGFSKALAEFPDNDTCLFYLGASLLNDGRYAEAVTVLRKLHSNPKSTYYPKGEFYLALAYWASGNQQEARSVLEKISQKNDHPFSRESRNLLKK